MNSYLQALVEEFREKSNPEKAYGMKKYMRNLFEYIGITSPERKILLTNFYKTKGKPKYENLHSEIKFLWNLSEREFQYVALDFMEILKVDFKKDDIVLLEYIIETKSWWDSIDEMSNITGHYFQKFPEMIPSITQKWIDSNNFWFQRSALLFQLKYKEKTDFELMCKYILKRANSTEFFVRKAIGWVLRQYSKYNPEAVINFVEQHKTELSNLSQKEALKVINRKK